MAVEEDGGLVVKIGADVASLKAGLTVATQDVNRFGQEVKDQSRTADTSVVTMARSIVTRLAAVAAAFLALTGGVTAFNRAVEDTKAVGELAEAMRVTVDQASRLVNVARELEIDIKTLTKATENLGRNIANNANQPMSDFALVTAQMGISLRDASGNIRSMGELLPELANRFATYTDETQKAQLAVTLFGREAGPRMLALLNMGADGIARATAEAHRMGLVTADQVDNAQAYTRAVNSAQAAVSELSREFMIRLAPAITAAANAITMLLRLLPQMRDTSQGSEDSIRALSDRILQEEAALATLEARAARQLEVQGRVHAQTQQMVDAKQRLIAELRAQLEAENALAAMQQGPHRPPPTTPETGGVPTPNPDIIRRGYEAGRFELEKFMERLTASRLITDELNFSWLSHAQIMEQVTQRVNAAFADRAEAARRVAQIELMLEKQKQSAMLQTASLAAQTITQLFPKSKAAGIAAAVINTAVGITNALSTGMPPWNWIQAGLIAASGAAQIATIRSTTSSGGTTPAVSGAGGGAGGNEGPTSSRMLSISGLSAEGRYSGRSVMELIDEISEEVRNGATLVSTTAMRQQSA